MEKETKILQQINIDLRSCEEYDKNDLIESLEKYCKLRNKYALYLKAMLIKDGVIPNTQKDQVINLLTLSSALGCGDSSFELGKLFYLKKKYNLAERYFLKSTYVKSSYYYLGMMEEKGLGRNISHHKAFVYFLKGSELNDYNCYYWLGYFYLKGIGIKKNEKKGRHYLYMSVKYKVDDTLDLYRFCSGKRVESAALMGKK